MEYRCSISRTAHFKAPAAFFASVTTGKSKWGKGEYTFNSTFLGSIQDHPQVARGRMVDQAEDNIVDAYAFTASRGTRNEQMGHPVQICAYHLPRDILAQGKA